MRGSKRVAALIALLTLILASVAVAQETTGEIPPEAAAGLAVAGIVSVVAAIVGLIVQIIVIVFLYKDATARGQSGALWGILGFFFGLLALIIWLVIRPKQ